MKLATWNVNSLNVRLPQVLDWLSAHPVDALCLQELKIPDERFPLASFQELGYHAAWAGQPTYNGVAIISRETGRTVQRNIPDFDDVQQRVLAVTLPSTLGDVRVVCVYCPNGQALDSDKYSYKLQWFAALRDWLYAQLQQYPRLAVLGDYNIAPADEDTHDPALWQDGILVSPAERAAFSALLELGLSDAMRLFPQAPGTFTWWDYRRFAWKRNAGLRIDHALVSDALRQVCTACTVDKTPRDHKQPSDHAPVLVTFQG